MFCSEKPARVAFEHLNDLAHSQRWRYLYQQMNMIRLTAKLDDLKTRFLS